MTPKCYNINILKQILSFPRMRIRVNLTTPERGVMFIDKPDTIIPRTPLGVICVHDYEFFSMESPKQLQHVTPEFRPYVFSFIYKHSTPNGVQRRQFSAN